LTKLVSKPSIVIDVGYEQGNRAASRAGLGNGGRSGIDEGVVAGEPSLMIEKNEKLLRAGAQAGLCPALGGMKTTVRAEVRMTQEKRHHFCHKAPVDATPSPPSRS
jgi:hypothetical protein